MKSILSLDIIRISGKHLIELRNEYDVNCEKYNHIPDYGINYEFFPPKEYILDQKGKIVDQYSRDNYIDNLSDENEQHYIFDLKNSDGLLGFEIEQTGEFSDIFKDIKILPFFEKLPIGDWGTDCECYENQYHLIIDLEYSNGTYEDPGNVDLMVKIIGFLNDSYEFCEI